MSSDAEQLGSELRAAREGRELTLPQAEAGTRIRAHYLAALEEGNVAALPSAVQGRGFLRNYARYLGLDGDVFVARFDAALRGSGGRRGRQPPVFADDPTLQSTSRRTPSGAPIKVQPTTPPPIGSTPAALISTTIPTPPRGESRQTRQPRQSRTRSMTLGTLAIVAATAIGLIVLLVYAVQSTSGQPPVNPILSPLPNQITTSDTPQDTNTPQSIDSPTPDRPTPLPNPSGSSLVSTAPPTIAGGISIQITVKVRGYLKITTDDTIVYAGIPAPETILQFTAKTSIQVHSGDAGGIEVSVNGISQGTLGQRHQIADKTFSAAATAVPTAISTALATAKATVTATPH